MDERLDANSDRPRDRRRFFAALALFFLWVAALGTMAVFSGRRPAPSPSAIEDR